MLVEFSVANFRSLKEIQTLSFVAAPIKSKYPDLDTDNLFEATNKLKLLKTIGIYGANGSGKSNFIFSITFFLIFIRNSFSNSEMIKRFDIYKNKTSDEPVFFQIIVIIENKKYRYGFEVLNQKVKSEWLYGMASKTETYYFTREYQNIKINPEWYIEGKGLEENTSETNLFLNICAFNNKPIAKSIKSFFESSIIVDKSTFNYVHYSYRMIKKMLEDDVVKQKIIEFMSFADLIVNDIKKIKSEPFDDEENSDKYSKISFSREFETELGIKKNIEFDLQEDESDGTIKYLMYAGLVINAINHGLVLILDEFDASLHPLLCKKIIQFFNSPKTNPKNAQLFFATHDTNLLDSKILRRDQIYFAEKNNNGQSVIYSLTDFKGIRNDASFQKDYLNGIYGAIPYLGKFDFLFDS